MLIIVSISGGLFLSACLHLRISLDLVILRMSPRTAEMMGIRRSGYSGDAIGWKMAGIGCEGGGFGGGGGVLVFVK